MASSRIAVKVGGSYTHYSPAERCLVTIRVSKEGDSQASVVESVSKTSNELAELCKSLCPKDQALERADEGVELQDPSNPVTHWSMSSLSTSSWIPYVPANPQGTEHKPAPRQYRACTNFSIKFKDFKKMGEVCLNVTSSSNILRHVADKLTLRPLKKNDDVQIQNLDWRLTDITTQKLKLTVRQGAVKDAVVKALDYCSVFSPSPETTWEIDAKEISDESSMGSVGYGNAAPKAMMMRSMGGGGGGGESSLNFEPEDVSISASVQCKFECSVDTAS